MIIAGKDLIKFVYTNFFKAIDEIFIEFRRIKLRLLLTR